MRVGNLRNKITQVELQQDESIQEVRKNTPTRRSIKKGFKIKCHLKFFYNNAIEN